MKDINMPQCNNTQLTSTDLPLLPTSLPSPPSAHCLLDLCSLCPDVGNHEGVAVPPKGVSEDVGEPRLPVGDVITPSVPQGYNHLENKANREQTSEVKVIVCVSSMRVYLFKEGERLVDVHGFLLCNTRRLWRGER